MKQIALAALLFVSAGTTCVRASDFNPLGFYVGAAVGQARDTVDNFGTFSFPLGGPFSLDESTTGWKAMAGLRPIPFLGAELEYLDFGSAHANTFLLRADTHADATALFAVGYLPVPLPFLDIFAKAGLARTHTSFSGVLSCPAPADCIVGLAGDHDDSDFAYGAGVQAKFQAFALRAEYERTDTSVGHPNLLSVGMTWTF
jgi:hypothetical protein